MTKFLDTDKKFCSILLDSLINWGVEDVVCSPGSRNSPLLIGIANREEFKKHFVVDERTAAFVGLGLSLVSQKPVALICTSGTALLNYAPAVAEAYYQGIPLVVISADRPIQWIDQDDSQTLRQDEALANYVKKSYSIPAYGDSEKELQWYVSRIVNDAMSEATFGRKGPVHINLHLGEPLSNKIPKECSISKKMGIILRSDTIGNKEIIRNLADKFVTSKVFIIAGFMQPDERLQKEIIRISRFPNVTIWAETLSNLHLSELENSIDSTLTAYDREILDTNAPTLLISVGGALVSRKLKEYLRRNSSCMQHWALGYSHTTADCFMVGVQRIETDPARFLKTLNGYAAKKEIAENCRLFKKKWEIMRGNALNVKDNYIKGVKWSELRAFNYILNEIPATYNIFFSNGTPVRYGQIIPHNLPHAEYCNRGVSGIDGSISTAIGGAIRYKRETMIITGDLSLAYDVGSLSLKEIPETFKIVVIDNQGGGIFRFIPSTSSLDELEEYFCQSPILPLRNLTEGYGWEYFEVDNEKGLQDDFEKFLKFQGKAIMRIVCDGKESAEILKNYMKCSLK